MLLLQAIGWIEGTLGCPNLSKFFLKNKSHLHLRGTHWTTMYHFHSALFAYFLYVSITSDRLCWSDPIMHQFEQIFLKNKPPQLDTPWLTTCSFHSALFIGLFAYFLYVTITSCWLGWIDPMMPQFDQIFLKNKPPRWDTPWPTMYHFHIVFLYVTITSYRLRWSDPMMHQFELFFFEK